jgi:hypothetical protein
MSRLRFLRTFKAVERITDPLAAADDTLVLIISEGALVADAELTMSRHHPDLVMCRKQPGISIGRLCDKCDGKCPGIRYDLPLAGEVK